MATISVRAHYRIESAMEHLYDVTVLGKTILTTLTNYPQAVTHWINHLDVVNVNRRIGFDVSMDSGTFQFYVANRCLVIQLRHFQASTCPILKKFLTDPNHVFVGIGINSKINLLKDQFGIEESVGFMDVGCVAAERYAQPELAYAEQSELLRSVLGTKVEKPELIEDDWDSPDTLSDDQVSVACVDAFLSFLLAKWLLRTGMND